jgi:hypothetical protein
MVDIENVPPRTLVAVGSVEETYVKSSQKFVKELKDRGGQAEVLVLAGQDHDDTALSLGDEKSELFQAVLTAIKAK